MKVTIDRAACIGCGLCEAICPEVFAMDDTGIAIVTQQPEALTEALQEAVDSCPTDAIHIE